uniref:RING-type domain-containing protein n=1 Tax=Hyaloperonospora arabidopsidis (strain Emoy2) TaxID=559515 RepID=M4BY56_HYAAE
MGRRSYPFARIVWRTYPVKTDDPHSLTNLSLFVSFRHRARATSIPHWREKRQHAPHYNSAKACQSSVNCALVAAPPISIKKKQQQQQLQHKARVDRTHKTKRWLLTVSATKCVFDVSVHQSVPRVVTDHFFVFVMVCLCCACFCATAAGDGRRTVPRALESAAEAAEASVGGPDDDFVEEIESEANEIRLLIARTAQLWSRVEPRQDVASEPLQPLIRGGPAPALSGRSTLSSDEDEVDGDEDDIQTQSDEMGLCDAVRGGRRDFNGDEAFGRSFTSIGSSSFFPSFPLIEREDQGERDGDLRSVGRRTASVSDEETSDEQMSERSGLMLEQDGVVGASIRALNASKACVVQNDVFRHLMQLGFREETTRVALEAGVYEIDHYGADCELEDADIFMSLVKLVCDSHVDVLNDRKEDGRQWVRGSASHEQVDVAERTGTFTSEQHSFLPFKWPVFDMAQFEFGNARPGTCFNSVCVLTNLPKVSMDRTEELMELLSYNLFCMIDDPIQVVIPSARSTGRTKGHAFLEFDDPTIAQRCAVAVDGLTWGKGPSGRIRGNLFRRYQAKFSAAKRKRTPRLDEDGASPPRLLSGIPKSRSVRDTAFASSHLHQRFLPSRDFIRQHLLCDSDDDSSDTGEYVVCRPPGYARFDPSPLLDLSSGSVDIEAQQEPIEQDYTEQLGWNDRIIDVGCTMQQRSQGEDNDETGEVVNNDGVLEFQCPDEGKRMGQLRFYESHYDSSICSQTRASLSSDEALDAPSHRTSTVSTIEHEAHACFDIIENFEGTYDSDDGAEKSWRRSCKDLIVCNREMQEQIALARIRIVQLSRNNQKLHLLADRVERDRDGLLYENDLLQTQLYGYEDQKRRYDSMMKELVSLRKYVAEQKHPFVARSPECEHFATGVNSLDVALSSTDSIQAALSHVSSVSLANCKFQELKEWEQKLENTLSQVRSSKEERALELQKKLDRQVEEQNELKLCVICLANEKRILCLPCRHLCLCETCAYRQEVTKCPICRLEIAEVLAVYS